MSGVTRRTAGTSRATVDAVLGEAQEDGLVRISRGLIHILEPESIAQRRTLSPRLQTSPTDLRAYRERLARRQDQIEDRRSRQELLFALSSALFHFLQSGSKNVDENGLHQVEDLRPGCCRQ